ncbi:hypothetical protein [Pontibacter beigongshangensis]|uniref:hypothetical protein n=1 Tax=Pontibacter beigongshangensis TaxID=2574733 RepID=UPI00164FF140|nr:hypothetical protein [Pontibacter beigongshangensis]
MKVLLFVTCLAGFSLTAASSSAQMSAAGATDSKYVYPAALDAQQQALVYHMAETPGTPETEPDAKAAAATKTMSEELSIWVENKQAVIDSYKRPKRRKAQPPL